ncbi:plasmid mobilization protein [Coleofasciculus sp.]|uniref:plasmid mobilization protein n=1 Tax=Coleofasciculus sp. TaxID=3100458 RepID=UPI003A1E1DDB
MSRPKIRTQQQKVWLTPSEKKTWKRKAAQAGLSVNEFIRRCVERRQLKTSQPPINLDTARELGRIGVNLNQQVRAMNTAIASGQFIPNVEEALLLVSEVLKLVQQVQSELLLDDRQNS